MVEAIVKTRGNDNLNSPVMVALYPADLNAVQWDAIDTMEPVNSKKNNAKPGIRSRIDYGDALEDIQGQRVGMITNVGGDIYRDVVTLKGTTNTGVIVQFDDEPGVNYTVKRAVARFVNGGF